MDTNLPNPGVRGWLLVLCVFLLFWQPLSIGLAAAAALDAVMIRGFAAMLLLFLRLLVTAVGVGAGLALLGRRIGAVTFAKYSLIVSATIDLLVYVTPYYPNRRAPGETPLWILGTVVLYGGWLLYLTRSRRVRDTFNERGLSS